jgi:fatty acid desaturase
MALRDEPSSAYAELREAIVAAGFLDRAYGYYAWRTALSMALLGGGVALGLGLPPSAGGLLVAALAIAFGSVQVALIGHDAGHLAVFRDGRANGLLGTLCWTVALGISFGYWRDRHARHHAHTNDAVADPDLQWAGLVTYSAEIAAARPPRVAWLTRYQVLLGPLYTLFLPFAFRVEAWQHTWRTRRGGARAGELGLLTLSSLAWIAPVLWLGGWWLVVYLVSQTLAGLYLALAIAPNHKGMPTWPPGTQLSFLERQVRSSRNVTPGRLTDFVFGGLNYQIEHHLFPTMPRVHFGRARALIRPFCVRQDLGYVELSAAASYALVLAELRRVGHATSVASGI